jgi:hypothetical protein
MVMRIDVAIARAVGSRHRVDGVAKVSGNRERPAALRELFGRLVRP